MEKPSKRPKKGSEQVVAQDEAPAETQPPKELKEVAEFQEKLERLNEQAANELVQVEQKYASLRQPIFVQRNEAIKKIPGFWKQAFRKHFSLGTVMEDIDWEIMEFLDSFEIAEFDDIKTGFKVSFKFKPNPFFQNAELFKEVHLSEQGDSTKHSDVKWNDPHFPEKNENSFFVCWFSDTYNDAEIADILKDDFWPDPVSHYLRPQSELDAQRQNADDNLDGNAEEPEDGEDDQAEDRVEE